MIVGGPPKKPHHDLGSVEATAEVLGDNAEAVTKRTRLLVLNEPLVSSFGSRDTDAADSYRNAAEVFADVADLLRAELNRGQRILSTVTPEYPTTEGDDAALVDKAVDEDATDGRL